ncbi:MAG: T9SS type A sorting domain-containing protein [Bacteroidales bacterium]|nr:T9SS type A sorting domain-containing protein [Bacteroidales bacterium]
MKHLLLTLLSLVILSAITAQPALQIFDQFDNDVTGKTITVYSNNPLVDLMESHLKVYNSGDTDLNVFVRRINNTAATNSSNAFCFGINCYPPTTDTSQVETPIQVGIMNTTFIGDYYPSQARGISSVTYEFYDNTTTANKVAASVTILYAVSDVIDILDEEGHIVNNSTIVVSSNDTSMAAYFDAKVKVRNNSSSDLFMYARRIQNSVVPGTTNTFCYGVCYPPFIDTSFVVVTIPGGGIDSNFVADYTPAGNAGATSLSYEFYDNYTLGEPTAASFTVIFNLSGVGMPENKGLSFSEPTPNPAASFTVFNFDLPASVRSAYLSIRSISGSEVEQIMLDRESGKAIVHTAALPAGLYLYSLVTDGKVNFTKKLLVRH